MTQFVQTCSGEEEGEGEEDEDEEEDDEDDEDEDEGDEDDEDGEDDDDEEDEEDEEDDEDEEDEDEEASRQGVASRRCVKAFPHDQKNIDFQLDSLRKTSILSAEASARRLPRAAGIEQISIFN